MEINVESRSLERFEQASDGSITIWKPEGFQFEFRLEAEASFMQTLKAGHVFCIENEGSYADSTFCDFLNGLIYHVASEDFMGYIEGEKITLYPSILNPFDGCLINIWLSDHYGFDISRPEWNPFDPEWNPFDPEWLKGFDPEWEGFDE